MVSSCEKIAKILRTDKDNIRLLEGKMAAATGRQGIMDKIAEENNFAVKSRLDILGLKTDVTAKQIYEGLLRKIEIDNNDLHKVLGSPRATVPSDWERVLDAAKSSVKPPKGFFLKKEKALEFLRQEPPLRVIRSLGYSSVDELIANENLFEVWASLRFLEGSAWLNSVFFKYYETLKPADFEEREITTLALPERWARVAQEFIKKKHHNISHLKELGVIYVLPLSLEISGETLRNFSLIIHYFSEIAFYSDLFNNYAKDEKTFAQNIISLLRGDVLDSRLASSDKAQWFIIQRYLAKEDPYDWRLFEPHISPEALHWERAERLLMVAARKLDHSLSDICFWQDLNWVGNYFKTEAGPDLLVSFNLIDASMSLAKEREMTKYLYHHQESLWNKIFIEYFSEEEMESFLKEDILKGYFEV